MRYLVRKRYQCSSSGSRVISVFFSAMLNAKLGWTDQCVCVNGWNAGLSGLVGAGAGESDRVRSCRQSVLVDVFGQRRRQLSEHRSRSTLARRPTSASGCRSLLFYLRINNGKMHKKVLRTVSPILMYRYLLQKVSIPIPIFLPMIP